MAYLNFFKAGSYTKIKEVVYNKAIGNIDLLFQVLDSEGGEEIIAPVVVKISKTIEKEKYEELEKDKLTPPPNSKPAEQTQEDYDAEIAAYTVATQKILDDADSKNAFSLFFTKDALYETSNIEACCYEWCKGLPLFEGVEDA